MNRAYLLCSCLLLSCTGDINALTGREGDDTPDSEEPAVAGQQPPQKSSPIVTPPPTMPPLNGSQGVFGCPTIDSPKYTAVVLGQQQQTGLSEQFTQACASCHGIEGTGLPGYPSLRQDLGQREFIDHVRKGIGEAMPAFDAAFISDETLTADYRVLQGAASDAEPVFGTEWDWDEQELAQARAEGLEAWRKPDPQGVACANCHTPDAIDLALLGYPDHAVTRRARLHLGPQDTLKVVKFVHAQRRHFNISEPCHPQYRPMQPGGQVLPGATPGEQDEAFGQVLRDRGLTIATGRVETLEDAQAALTELGQIDLRTLPTGIPLPRWTEDGFNGPEHSTMNDYMPPLGFRPKDHQAWYELEDAYVAEPSEANLLALMGSFSELNDDGGYAEMHDTKISNCRSFRTSGSFLRDMAKQKRLSQLLMQHWMRRGVLEGLTMDQIPALPLGLTGELADRGLNPFMRIAKRHIEAICYPSTSAGRRAGEAIIAAMPQDVIDELPQADLDDMSLQHLPKQMNHPWMTLSQIYDPSFGQGSPHQNSLHYWQVLKFPHKRYHRPFYALHRNVLRAQYYELTQRDPTSMLLPGDTRFGRVRIHPWLDGNRIFVRQSVQKSYAHDVNSARMVGNTIRAVLLVQIELLGQGLSFTNHTTFSRSSGTYKEWSKRLRRDADEKGLREGLGDDYLLYTDGIDELCAQVEAALVPEQKDESEQEVSSR